MNLGQAQEQQQREPDPGGDRLEIQADAEEEEQHGAERLMSPEVAKHSLIRQSAAAFSVTARVWIADWGYQQLRKDLGPLKPTGLFRLLLPSDPGPVEDLSGELSQLVGRAGLIPLDDEKPGMQQDHQLPSLLRFAISGRPDPAILALMIAASRSRISIRRVVTASPLRGKSWAACHLR